MHDLETSLAQIRNAWLAGRSALEHAPAQWREAISAADELALIALAGHATDVLTRRAPGAPLVERPLLPAVWAPLIPDALRPRFRRVLVTARDLPSLERHLIAFAAARGYAAHPADWIPDAKDEHAPDLYAPWLDWVRAETAAAPVSDLEITAESYEQWSWSERRKALGKMRAQNPAAALAIIAAKAGGEPAERRLRLIEMLQTRLSEADAEYLETLAKDRSDRVQALARALLARLGRGAEASDLATELAAMVELRRVGLLKRRMQLAIKPLKTGAQAARRRELFPLVSLAALASALNTSELQLVDSAPDGAPEDTLAFVTCAATTGSDAAVRALLEQLLEDKETVAALSRPLAERLTAAERSAVLQRMVARDNDMLEVTLSIAGPSLGRVPLAALTAAPSYSALKANIKAFGDGDDAGRTAATHRLDRLLPNVGLLLDPPGARALLEQIAAWGLSPADPRLDMLHLNAALTPENEP